MPQPLPTLVERIDRLEWRMENLENRLQRAVWWIIFVVIIFLFYTDTLPDILYQAGEKLAYAIADLRVPMYSDGAHWHSQAMVWELLSPTYSNRAALSAVTLSALADIGYTVDMSRVESVPRSLTKPAAHAHFYCDGRHILVKEKRSK